jgi:hypothetical protein
LSLPLARQGSASFWKKKQKLWLFGIGVSISVTLYSEKFFGSFFKKEPLAFWAGTQATPIPQESGSRPVGISCVNALNGHVETS